MLLLLCALCCTAARRSPSCAPRLLTLRGGASSAVYGRTSITRSPYQYESQRDPRQSNVGRADEVDEPAMSDAERVQVLQQFGRAAVRKAFLQKVYAILAGQLVATAVVIGLMRTQPQVLALLAPRLPLFAVLPLAPLMLLQSRRLTKSRQAGSPLAYSLLGLFTLLQALVLGVGTSVLPLVLVLRAAMTTAIATGALSVYALTTPRDFTTVGGLLSAGLMGLITLGLSQAVFGGQWLHSAQIGFGTHPAPRLLPPSSSR